MSNQIQTLIQVELEDRNRLTAFFRLIIVLPVAIYLSAFAIDSMSTDTWGYSLGGLIVLPTFLALVFRGIYPSYALAFNHALISLETRVNAYALLLTDDYPSIEENEIVKITFPEVGNGSQLNRYLPLVKWFLAIPLYVMGIIYLIYGLFLTAFAWFSILFSGKYPVWCADAMVGILAFYNRVYGYAFILVTDEYPSFSLQLLIQEMTRAPIARAKMQRITAEISATDKRFAKVISESPLCSIGSSISPESNFQSLVSSVISQQLAVKAADTIHGRLNQLAKGQITPVRIAKLSDTALREIGVSGAKAKTIQGLAQASLTGSVPIENLHELSDEEVFTGLTSLWGIGPWTVDMFMMFQLHRLDIWPTGDLGIRRGWESIHKLDDQIEPKALDIKGEKFRPYRSVVAWYCWRHLDNIKQEKKKQEKK